MAGHALMYIGSKPAKQTFKRRCEPIIDDVKLGTVPGLGQDPNDEYFAAVQQAMSGGSLQWAIFHLPSISSVIGEEEAVAGLVKLATSGTQILTRAYIIDPSGLFGKSAKETFAENNINVVADESHIGPPFDKMHGAYPPPAEEEEEDASKDTGIDPFADQRIPGSSTDTPVEVSRNSNDPFAKLEQVQEQAAAEEDLFGEFMPDGDGDAADTPEPAGFDPFADFGTVENPAGGMPEVGAADIFEELGFTDATDAEMAAVASDIAGGDVDFDMFDDILGEVGAESGTESTGGADGPGNGIPDFATPIDFDPFADVEKATEDDFAKWGDMSVGSGSDGNGSSDDGDGGERLALGDGQDLEFESNPENLTVVDLLERFGGLMDRQEMEKLASMIEPSNDYELELNDMRGVGGLFRRNGLGGGISQVGANELYSSAYIAEEERINGYYSPPDSCKIVVSYACKGGTGKSHPLETKLPYYNDSTGTIEWTTIGNICPGMIVFNRDGRPVRVLDIFDQGELDVYKLTLTDGREVESSKDHIWPVLKRGDNAAKDHIINMTVEEMLEQPLMKNAKRGHGEYRYKLPVGKAIELPEKELPISPYALGALLGDGYLGASGNRVGFSTADQFMLDELSKELGPEYYLEKRRDDECDFGYYVNEYGYATVAPTLKTQLRKLGVACRAEHKFIPNEYKQGSISQRLSLIQGLMDTDGCSNQGRFSFSTISARLRDDFMEVLRTLGLVCSYSEDRREGKYPTTGVCYTVFIRCDTDMLFRLPRKKENFRMYQGKQTKREPIPKKKKLATVFEGQKSYDEVVSVTGIDPYLYGLLISRRQGYSFPLVYRGRDNNVIERVKALMPDGVDGVHKGHSAQSDLYSIAVLQKGAKNIIKRALQALDGRERPTSCPINEQYLLADEASRMALLNGILDGQNRFTRNGFPAVNSHSQEFEDTFVSLVESLGYTVHKEHKKKSAKGHVYEYDYIVLDTTDTGIFYSDSLKAEFAETLERCHRCDTSSSIMGQRNEYVSITSIEKTGEKKPMRCLLVDDPSHLFLVGDYIPTHNTTVAVGVATQLNWVMNRELMQRLTTSTNCRVLLFSLNEFDDIVTHKVGYGSIVSEESENDGIHVGELLRCINELEGKRKVQWSDISHCFVSTDNNRIYYLPSMTLRERLEYGNGEPLSAEDYSKILATCAEFFQFIVLDMPDVLLQEKSDLVSFALQVSDINMFIAEADSRSTLHLYHFFDAITDDKGNSPIDADKSILVVNKYVEKDNPYMAFAPEGQIPYEEMTKGLARHFARAIAIPFTRPKAHGNIIAGTDDKVKKAFQTLVDYVLALIDWNDKKESDKAKGAAKATRH